ncbi:MAG: DUF4347 domain-containing protein, partial [Planctomycetales bacterium]|nr:DUF4347 domain-containing protein [Planctomycetales bacterium]
MLPPIDVHQRFARRVGNAILRSLGRLHAVLGDAAPLAANRPLETFALEDRVLFSGTPLALADDLNAVDNADAPDVSWPDDGDLWSSLDPADVAAPVDAADAGIESIQLLESLDQLIGTELSSASSTEAVELIVVDGSVHDADQLIDLILQDLGDVTAQHYEVLRLDGNLDGVAQITAALRDLNNVSAIHVISHGTDGQVQLGAEHLDLGGLQQYAADIESWRLLLTDDADVLFYGCDLAQDADGEAFLDEFARLSGADVAASDNVTGHADLGGDWELEYSLGTIDADTLGGHSVHDLWHHSLDLTATGGETLVVDSGAAASNQYATPNGGGNIAMNSSGQYAVVWDDYRNGNSDVFVKVFNADGTVHAGDLQVNTSNASVQNWSNVAVADNGNFIVTWSDNRSGTYEVYMRLFDFDGNALTGETLVSTTTGSQDAHAVDVADDGSFVIAFQSGADTDIYFQRYNASGVAQGANTRVNTTLTDIQNHPDIAVNGDGSFVISWMSNLQDGSGYGMYAQRFTAAGAASGGEIQIAQTTTGNQWYGSIEADSSGNFVATWMSDDGDGYGIYARRFNSAGTALGNEFQVNTFTTLDQGSPHVDMNATGDFVVVWHDSSGKDGSGFGVYAQEFDSAGTRIGGEVHVSTTTSGSQERPTVAFHGSSAVVVWQGNGTGDSQGIFTQRFTTTNYSTLTVDTLLDVLDGDTSSIAALLENRGADGKISLREAIRAANSSANGTGGNDIIYLSSGTHVLTIMNAFEDAALTGDLDITSALTILGAGVGSTSIDGAGIDDRILEVRSGGSLTISGVTLQNADTTNLAGGALLVTGSAYVTDVNFVNNNANNSTGGAAHVTGTAVFNRISVVGNSAANGGGMFFETAISATVTNATFSGNTSTYDGGAIAINKGTASIDHVTVSNNNATGGNGGGIVRLVGPGTISISNSIVYGNTAFYTGNDVYGDLPSAGYNIIGSSSGMTLDGTDLTASPGLAALTVDANSGQYVHAITTSSNAYNSAGSSPPATDQRGVVRFAGSADRGAYEVPNPPTDIVFDSEANSEQIVNVYATSDQIDPAIASFADGGYVVVWVSNGQDGSGYGIYGQRYHADGTTNGGQFLVTSETTDAETNPSVSTFSDGGFVVAWQDQTSGAYAWTEARIFNSDSTAATSEFKVSPGTDGNGEGYQPAVQTVDDSHFMVVWANETGGTTYEVTGNLYDRAGTSVSGQFVIGSLVSGTGLFGAQTEITQLDDGGLAVVWRTHNGTTTGVRARVVNADGSMRSSELVLAGDNVADIASLEGGGFVVTYDSSGMLKASVYDASGNLTVAAFDVNTTVSAARYESTVSRSDAGFVVVWESDNGDGSGTAILAQRFDGLGVKIGSEVVVNQTTAGDQRKAELVATASGALIAVWQSDNVDGDLTGIVTRMVTTASAAVDENAANGARVADVIGVMDLDPGDTHTFALTDDAGGRFAINSSTGEITVAN